MIGNDYRSKEALGAASAGIEVISAFFADGGDMDTNGNGVPDSDETDLDGILKIDADRNGVLDVNLAVANAVSDNPYEASITAISDDSSVTASGTIVNSLKHVRITSVGNSEDGRARRSISQEFMVFTNVLGGPPVPLIAKDNVALSGNVTIENTVKSEDDNDSNDFVTIWAGGNVALSGSAKTESAKGVNGSKLNCEPSCTTAVSNVVQNDAALPADGDAFFDIFFNQPKAQVKASADIVIDLSGDTNISSLINNKTGVLIWVDADDTSPTQHYTITINGGSVIGKNASGQINPVVLILERPLDVIINGGVEVYGFVYIIGDFNQPGAGNLEVFGSAVVEGTVLKNGTPNVVFDPDLLNNLKGVGRLAKIPGTWRDF